MYFDEFLYVTQNVTIELFFSVYNLIFNYVPCAQNFLYLRMNFLKAVDKYDDFMTPDTIKLPPPVLSKSIEKITHYISQGSRRGGNFFKRENSIIMRK